MQPSDRPRVVYTEYMGLFVQQNDTRTKLQERIAAEMSDKAKKKAELEAQDLPDGVTDSRYIENTKATTSLAWVWMLIIFAAVAAAFYFVYMFATDGN